MILWEILFILYGFQTSRKYKAICNVNRIMNGSNTRRCTGHKVTKKIYSIRIILKLNFNVENFEKCFYICAHTFWDVMIRSTKMNRIEGENVNDIVR